MTNEKLECKLDECIFACRDFVPAKDVQCGKPKKTAWCNLYGCSTKYHGLVPPEAYSVRQIQQAPQNQPKVITQ